MLNEMTTAGKVAIVIAVVEAFKGLGLNSKWAILLSVISGVVLELASVASVQFPDAAPWIEAIFAGAIVVGLGAAGVYRLSKRAGTGVVTRMVERSTIASGTF